MKSLFATNLKLLNTTILLGRCIIFVRARWH